MRERAHVAGRRWVGEAAPAARRRVGERPTRRVRGGGGDGLGRGGAWVGGKGAGGRAGGLWAHQKDAATALGIERALALLRPQRHKLPACHRQEGVILHHEARLAERDAADDVKGEGDASSAAVLDGGPKRQRAADDRIVHIRIGW